MREAGPAAAPTGPVAAPASPPGDAQLRSGIADALELVRTRTHRLMAGMRDEDLHRQAAPEVSPPAWDLGHIAWFEDLWLVGNLGGARVSAPDSAGLYDADRAPRPERGVLPLLDRPGLLRYQAEVRDAALRVLGGLDVGPDAKDPLTRGGFAHRMIVNHESQHQENLLHGLARMPSYTPPREPAPEPVPGGAPGPGSMVRVPGGAFPLGADLAPGVYDNEAPAHAVEVPKFWMDASPVTNGAYLRFIEARGYEEDAHWSDDGAMLKGALGWQAPLGWRRLQDGSWARQEFDREVPLRLDEPVMHVSWYEADAYARWAGKRLPTEAEWEKACTWDPSAGGGTGGKRRWPWGDAPWSPRRANLDQRLFRPAPVGSHPDGVSAVGCHQMVGDVWEWTASELRPYPGFRDFPYPEYSVPWMRGGWFVLRGGSWASRPNLARPVFRNWGQPDHRQLFAGFRCARDEPPTTPGGAA